MRLLPAIDIIEGKCVRLTKGDYAQKKVYSENPLEVAKGFEGAGLSYLHLVDLDGAKAGKVINWKVVEQITSETGLVVDFGGGVKKKEDIERLFNLGVKQVNLGSIAVKQPDLVEEWITLFGSEKIILSADVKQRLVAVSGWMEDTKTDIVDFIRDYLKRGILYVTCTDISVDGTLAGPNTLLYKELMEKFPQIRLVASGGVASIEDLKALKEIDVDGVIVGKAIYEGKISVEELNTI